MEVSKVQHVRAARTLGRHEAAHAVENSIKLFLNYDEILPIPVPLNITTIGVCETVEDHIAILVNDNQISLYTGLRLLCSFLKGLLKSAYHSSQNSVVRVTARSLLGTFRNFMLKI